MKNFLIALTLALPCVARAQVAAVAPVLDTQSGTRVSASAATNISLIGAPVYRIEVSTPVDTPILLLSGQGLLYSVRCTSGSVGAYAMAMDSASSSGITIASAGKALTGQVLSSGQVTLSASSQTVILGNDQGLDTHGSPIPFNNGLVGIVHGSAANCFFQARLSKGNNPGP